MKLKDILSETKIADAKFTNTEYHGIVMEVFNNGKMVDSDGEFNFWSILLNDNDHRFVMEKGGVAYAVIVGGFMRVKNIETFAVSGAFTFDKVRGKGYMKRLYLWLRKWAGVSLSDTEQHSNAMIQFFNNLNDTTNLHLYWVNKETGEM